MRLKSQMIWEFITEAADNIQQCNIQLFILPIYH